MTNRKPSISIFFPFLNDWGTVGSLVGLAISTVEKLTDDWEVIIVNDGSRKEDREALESVVRVINKKENPGRIRVIHHEKNRGYGGALRSGFAAATKDLIFYTDCDAQYDPRELTRLYEEMKAGIDSSTLKDATRQPLGLLRQHKKASAGKIGMVNGYKIKRSDPWYRTIAGRMYHYLVKFVFLLPIRDTDCDFRLIRREIFTKVKLFENTGTICTELVKKIDHFGYKIAEVPVHHYWRTSGKSQFFNFKRLFNTGTNLFRLWWKLMVGKEYEK